MHAEVAGIHDSMESLARNQCPDKHVQLHAMRGNEPQQDAKACVEQGHITQCKSRGIPTVSCSR